MMVVGSTLMVKKKALTLVTCPESESERKTGNGTLAPAQSLFADIRLWPWSDNLAISVWGHNKKNESDNRLQSREPCTRYRENISIDVIHTRYTVFPFTTKGVLHARWLTIWKQRSNPIIDTFSAAMLLRNANYKGNDSMLSRGKHYFLALF